MKKSTKKSILVATLALMAFAAIFDTVKVARAEVSATPTQVVKPGRR